MDKKMYDLINELTECQAVCNYCFNACLEESDVQMMVRCIKLDKDCSEICGPAISLAASESEFTNDILELLHHGLRSMCPGVRKTFYDHCKECAQACRKCAAACKSYM